MKEGEKQWRFRYGGQSPDMMQTSGCYRSPVSEELCAFTKGYSLSRKRKHKALSSRRKRMTRPGRLASARSWLKKFSGSNVVRGYAKWFGVDLVCAVKELSLLGVTVDPAYVAKLKTTFDSRKTGGPKQPVVAPQSDGYGRDWDENFAYIAGRTEAGFPYGVTWEELAESEAEGTT